MTPYDNCLPTQHPSWEMMRCMFVSTLYAFLHTLTESCQLWGWSDFPLASMEKILVGFKTAWLF